MSVVTPRDFAHDSPHKLNHMCARQHSLKKKSRLGANVAHDVTMETWTRFSSLNNLDRLSSVYPQQRLQIDDKFETSELWISNMQRTVQSVTLVSRKVSVRGVWLIV